MNEYLVPLTSACTLVTLNYMAMKVRSKMLIDSYEHLLAPLLTGLASIIMMLVPLPELFENLYLLMWSKNERLTIHGIEVYSQNR